ncbi:flavodoxin-dependent (E)-4-hydroxy-3-methylbut-2-enyl-diphosphate synthase [Phaeovibrio sulfidiphilus]|uniref:4-hydroxy-3-methylbut-2-en-1-yl diphosphate synthase (flavodoxin) n=1 Tax=Phaeovibrio sulfidiphilus TaxID=1220600 RepID=A0A8J6YMH7_9PROT|nr:flavodoxin-dependent (E)-4-hydroxy-3-methylbut-2-enyl-diphosphate synthase [Phaeovibrio sulfidiphilus]MBE1237175.1 flavodoxin-dependent (E)-4-hydroxy-3-methylbut-2-enyl-diphosphate synthase [Phaeovibrio sulfidiphilus]
MSAQRSYREIKRRVSRQIRVGSVLVGGDAPISVQTMTNTLTPDIQGTIAQIQSAEEAGADLVRVSCPDTDSTAALATIVKNVNLPIIADIHFHYMRGIEAAEAGAACLRINPGNIGSIDKVQEVVKAARDNGCSMRIGVNAASLPRNLLEKYGEPCPEAMVESALEHAKILEDLDFREFKISVKASDTFLAVASYRALAAACDYPLHLGITEAGGIRGGTVKSAIGIGALLWDGIGDTLRVSLSAAPAEEVKVGFEILKALDLRHRGVRIISCPSCARQGFDVVKTVEILEERLSHVREPVSLSVMGCVVNGPGEARETDIGLTGAGNLAKAAAKNQVYIAGEADHHVDNQSIVDHLVKLVEEKAAELQARKAAEKKG